LVDTLKHNVVCLPANRRNISEQVDTLVSRLKLADELQSMQVNLRCREHSVENVWTILRPFNKLMNVRDGVEVFGLPSIGSSSNLLLEEKCSFRPGEPSFTIQYPDSIVEETEQGAYE